MFAAADLMVLNKIDLAPHLSFDEAACIGFARRVNPQIQVLRTSATRGDGIDAWVGWVMGGLQAMQHVSQASEGRQEVAA